VIRGVLVFLAVVAVFVVAVALSGDPGRATLLWLGWRLDTSATVAALMIGILSLLAVTFWRLALWLAEAPRRTALARAENRRRQAADMLSRGFLAVASGEAADARRWAQKAADSSDESSALVRLLAAQSAEAVGDLEAARAAYTAMLSFPEMRLVGWRGLTAIAAAQGDKAAALKHAEEAFAQARTGRWAWRTLFEARVEAGQWREALDLVDTAQQRKILKPPVADRARAALLSATAAAFESDADPKLHDQAVDLAVKAAKLSPGFAPGAVIAARLLGEAGKLGRAQDVIEHAWETAPHPPCGWPGAT
jgi:HemY protein